MTQIKQEQLNYAITELEILEEAQSNIVENTEADNTDKAMIAYGLFQKQIKKKIEEIKNLLNVNKKEEL